MYSPHEIDRGGGRRRGGGGERNAFPGPYSHHPSAAGRFPYGGSAPGGRNLLASTPVSSTAQVATEESFSLVPGTFLSFAAIIRLAPDLVDEIQRVEAQGGAARIKFDSHQNNPSGNVFDVGGKEFRFTWSPEMGELCDIYEEDQNGEDGDWLLVESGRPWRKLNVRRILDESTKNHLKMISEEAKRNLESQKAIVLDPGNPSVKSRVKELASDEVSPLKTLKQKKEPPFKKQKVESPQAGGPPKDVHKYGFPSTTPVKGRLSTSPVPSAPDQSDPIASPSATGNLNNVQAIAQDPMAIQESFKENVVSSVREIPSRAFGGVQGTTGFTGNQSAMSTDLQDLLITLLKEKPNGMSIKALEKAVGNTIHSSVRKIEPILKKIATFQASGQYLLKPGVEVEKIIQRSFAETGSSPGDNSCKMTDPEDNHGAVPGQPHSCLTKNFPAGDFEEQAFSESTKYGEHTNLVEKIEITQHSSAHLCDKKGSVNSEGQAGSSSNTGNDSDKDSNRSDSDSPRRTSSTSPEGSGSVSSSDSDSGSSYDSKEGSDVDVDIITIGDEKEPNHSGINEKQDSHGSQDVEIEDLPDNNQEAEQTTVVVSATNADVKSVEKYQHTSPDHKHQDMFNGRENIVSDDIWHEQLDGSEKSRGKYKRAADTNHLEEDSHHLKRSKAGILAQSSKHGHRAPHFSGNQYKISPGRLNQKHYKSLDSQMPNMYNSYSVKSDLQKGYNYATPEKTIAEMQQSSRRSAAWSHDTETADRSGKHADSLGRCVKYQEQSVLTHGLPKQKDKFHRVTPDEIGNSSEKSNRKVKESGRRNGQPMPWESEYRKYGDHVKKFNMEVHLLNSQIMGSSLKASDRGHSINAGRSSLVNGRCGMLHRELSDLEFSELRKPFPKKPGGDKKQFERKGSFKQWDTKGGNSDTWNAHLGREKPAGPPNLDAGKPSTPNLRAGVPGNLKGSSKRWPPYPYTEDPLRPLRTLAQSHLQNSAAEMRSLSNKAPNISHQAIEGEQIGIKGYGDTHKSSHVRTQHHDSKQELAPCSVKRNKSQNSNASADATDRRKGDSLNKGHNGDSKRRKSSDEDNLYSKYERDEPELKGPIKDFSQYKEYVQEYQEKYDSYCSLNNILEGVRKDFEKLGRDLISAKGRDMVRYQNIVDQLRERYRHCGPRHMRLKKIFLVLHEELKNLKQRIKYFAEPYIND
ncbi:hypothetical protein Nepgr_005578 [Nepenthes gracilis]|uniref:OCEL domain-containing protein n=1 Tax=Nepenthes gracilis TaxID=150966 RepID=A0AAD3S3G9_NEPGR|nr:hypothetical protein Nepgr_005578 [Nepenthes gracilis]